jgi:hypothetical protein
MKTFTVTVACYDAWNEQTLVVEANSAAGACAKAIGIADSEYLDRYWRRSWDPEVTFVAGVVTGGDLRDNDAPGRLDPVIGGRVPFKHSEAAAFNPRVLLEALKAALPELESELDQRQFSGIGEEFGHLRAVVLQVRTAIAGVAS